LAGTVAELENAPAGRRTAEVPAVAAAHGVTAELLRSAVAARDAFGKIHAVIHAAAIALALPHLLGAGALPRRESAYEGLRRQVLCRVRVEAVADIAMDRRK
jgi:hypothetical protein